MSDMEQADYSEAKRIFERKVAAFRDAVQFHAWSLEQQDLIIEQRIKEDIEDISDMLTILALNEGVIATIEAHISDVERKLQDLVFMDDPIVHPSHSVIREIKDEIK